MDKKLTDNEIVKALEDCVNYNDSCSSCPSNKFCYKHDSKVIMKATLDLINRLQAENEDLKTEKQILSQKRFNIFERIEYADKIKAEAYKELINLLESRLVSKTKITAFGYEIAIIEIKNLLKELVGE